MKTEWKACFRIGVSAFALYLCITYWACFAGFAGTLVQAAMPLILGCVIAYLVNILMSFYEKHYFRQSDKPLTRKSRRPVCMAAAMVTLIAVLVLIFWLVVPQLTACMQLLWAKVPDALRRAVAWLDERNILPENIAVSLAPVDWRAMFGRVIKVLVSGIGSVTDIVASAVSSVVSGIVTVFMAVIFSIYLLLGKDTIGSQCTRLMERYLKKSWYDKFMYMLAVMHDCFRRYIIGQCTEAVILGLLCTAGMWILRLPYATMIGALIAFTALIPVAGAYIGGGIGAFMIFTVSPVKAVIFLVFLVTLQQLEGNLIYPRVVGSSMGLPAIWVLAAVTIGGGMMGIAGMMLSVPVAAALYRLLREDVKKSPERALAET